MKRNIKRMVAFIGVLMTVVCSVVPSYYVYAEVPVSQEITSDDNIVQKLYNYTMSAIGALNKSSSSISAIPTNIANSVKETIASLMNGGGIYIDSNGDYVFSDEACNQIYGALSNNSSIDANVVSNFGNFSYNADGYINSQYLTDVNALTAYYKISGSGALDGVNSGNGTSGKYILCSYRYTSGNYVVTGTMACDLGNVAYIVIQPLGSGNNNRLVFYDSSSNIVSVPLGFACCCYNSNGNSYSNGLTQYLRNVQNIAIASYSGSAFGLWGSLQGLEVNPIFNSFPNFNPAGSTLTTNVGTLEKAYFYCNNSLIISKNSVAANGLLNQYEGIFYDKFENTVVNNTVLESNNWENIYNSYIQNVNIDYQDDTSISTSDFRKLMKKYTGSIIDAIQNGSQNIEESISISNRYLQAISLDVRNISEKLDDVTGGGSGGGITPEQYNSIMGKLEDINDNAVDIASSTATISSDIDAIYEDTHGISEDMGILLENSADTNTNLVAIHTLLNNINSKIRDRNHDNPLPDDNFWMLLDDELDDYTDTFMDSLTFKLQMIGTVLQGVVPFGYVAVIGVMLNALAVQPEEPVFEIDLNSDSTTIPVHFNSTIDLSWVADIMPMVRAFQVMLFILGLIWASFEIFTTLGSLFG